MCTGGIVVTIRPLPSLVTTQNSAGFRYAEVHPGDSHVRVQEYLAQCPSGRSRQGRNVLGVFKAQLLLEELAHLMPAQVHRRCDDMRRFLPSQLDDVLAQVRLHGPMPPALERGVQSDLLGDHGLGLRKKQSAARLARALWLCRLRDLEHQPQRVCRIHGAVDLHPVSARVFAEGCQEFVQMLDRFGAHAARELAASRHVRE